MSATVPASWASQVYRAFASGHLTRAWKDALIALYRFRGAGGVAWPAHATLADRAHCCPSTVQAALNAGRALGLVDWKQRRQRVAWRSLRTSNVYRFLRPEQPLSPVPGRPRASTLRPGAVRSIARLLAAALTSTDGKSRGGPVPSKDSREKAAHQEGADGAGSGMSDLEAALARFGKTIAGQ